MSSSAEFVLACLKAGLCFRMASLRCCLPLEQVRHQQQEKLGSYSWELGQQTGKEHLPDQVLHWEQPV